MSDCRRLTSCALLLLLTVSFTPRARADGSAGPPWGSEAGTVELGPYGGVFIPSTKHELYDASLHRPFQKFAHVAPEFGVRIGYFPLRVLGIEAEGSLIPTQTRTTSDELLLWNARGHLILQAPTKVIVPFLLVGGGALAIASPKRVLGSDIDPELHVGIGAKAYLASWFALRLDLRDIITNGRGNDEVAMHWEALLGLTFVLGRSAPPPPPPPDVDHDSVIDSQDECPQVPGVPPRGCPPDSDGDGVLDPDDRCPQEPGVATADPATNGCPPPPPPDGDHDGVPDANDACPTVAGDGPDGCLRDTDGDGIPDRDDKCPDQPETKNGFQDNDGCPDELPAEVKKFTGVISGIAFDSGKSVIRPSSFATLDAAAKVLNDNPTLRVEISGHTDSTGSATRNLTLSAERAEAVKTYLVGKGVAADRIETRGAGPNEPVAENSTPAGRSKNRRIEFKLLQ